MSINTALIDRPIPARTTSEGRRINVFAVIRRSVGRRAWPQPRAYVNIGGSYRIPDGRRAGSNWLHAHH